MLAEQQAYPCCPHCGGILEATGETFEDSEVLRCRDCHAEWWSDEFEPGDWDANLGGVDKLADDGED